MLCVVQGGIDRPVLHIADCSDTRPDTKFLKGIYIYRSYTNICITYSL